MYHRFRRSRVIWSSLVLMWSCAESQPYSMTPHAQPSSDAAQRATDTGPTLFDSSIEDATSVDSSLMDAGIEDVIPLDTSVSDSGAQNPDAGASDASFLDADMPDLGWRSQLYPSQWTPAFQGANGHRLHDFSYAGYKNAGEPIGVPTSTIVYDLVSQFNIDNSGQADVTSDVQQVIDQAVTAGGGIIYFSAGEYRFDGQLIIRGSNIVLRGEDYQSTKLFFTRFSGFAYQSHILFQGNLQQSHEELLVANAAAYQNEVYVHDASQFAVGDDVVLGWNITDEFIDEHQMTGTWDHSTNAFKYTWQPFFRRQVMAVDTQSNPNKITVDVPLRYLALVRDAASIKKETGYLEEVGVEKLSLGNAIDWDDAWSVNQVHVLEMKSVKDAWIRDVHSYDPPVAPTSGYGRDDHLQSGGMIIRFSKRVTVADSEMHGAQNKGGGGNGYLFEVRQSSEVLFRDLIASKGRHNFIQNWGFGVSGCVWLRVQSSSGNSWLNKFLPGGVGYSEFHHSLALANLIDQSQFDDGWSIVNRGNWSSYSGHTGTQNVMWNTSGTGTLRSKQYGFGYVIGTKDVTVDTSVRSLSSGASGTSPEDYTEGLDQGDTLYPPSLYEDQLRLRIP